MNIFIEIAYFIRDWWPLVAAFFGALIAGYKGVSAITDSLRRITNQLERLNDKLLDFEQDRTKIWGKLDLHEDMIDNIKIDMAKYSGHISEAEKNIKDLYGKVDMR